MQDRIRITYVLLALFITVFVLGIVWGGFGKVLANGVVICLDCMGLV